MFERRERRHLRLVHPMAQDVGDVETGVPQHVDKFSLEWSADQAE